MAAEKDVWKCPECDTLIEVLSFAPTQSQYIKDGIRPLGMGCFCGSDMKSIGQPAESSPICVCGVPAGGHGGCRNYRPNVPCPSTYTHSSLGKLSCEKDKGHLDRIGDVEHRLGQTVWMSV